MTKKLSILFFLIIGLVAPIVISAWTGPAQTPPLGNTDAPLNVSSSAQTKVGPLVINTGGAATGLVVRNGNVGIKTAGVPAVALEVNGDINATAFYYTSDKSLKSNISPLTNALSKIMKLSGVSFAWKDTGAKSVGLVAQDVEKVYPELVHTNPVSGIKSVEYGNLVAPLIEAIKEQQKQIDALKAEIDALKGAN